MNATADSIGYGVTTPDDAARLDLLPGPFPATTFGQRLVGPGASASVPVTDISGYTAESGVVFFIYRVSGGQATYATSINASGAELRAAGFRLTVLRTASQPR